MFTLSSPIANGFGGRPTRGTELRRGSRKVRPANRLQPRSHPIRRRRVARVPASAGSARVDNRSAQSRAATAACDSRSEPCVGSELATLPGVTVESPSGSCRHDRTRRKYHQPDQLITDAGVEPHVHAAIQNRLVLKPSSAARTSRGRRLELWTSALAVARVLHRTTAEGPYLRSAVWIQGCSIRCPGCINPHLFEFAEGTVAPTVLAEEIVAANVEGLTLLGGEPFDQAGGRLR